MAHTKSTIKRIKQSKKRHARNIGVKSSVKTLVKKFEAALEAKEKGSPALLLEVYRSLDKAVTKGVMKKNTASRRKSRLAKQLNAKS